MTTFRVTNHQRDDVTKSINKCKDKKKSTNDIIDHNSHIVSSLRRTSNKFVEFNYLLSKQLGGMHGKLT